MRCPLSLPLPGPHRDAARDSPFLVSEELENVSLVEDCGGDDGRLGSRNIRLAARVSPGWAVCYFQAGGQITIDPYYYPNPMDRSYRIYDPYGTLGLQIINYDTGNMSVVQPRQGQWVWNGWQWVWVWVR